MTMNYRDKAVVEDGFVQITDGKSNTITIKQYKSSVQGIVVRGNLDVVKTKLDILLGPNSNGRGPAETNAAEQPN